MIAVQNISVYCVHCVILYLLKSNYKNGCKYDYDRKRFNRSNSYLDTKQNFSGAHKNSMEYVELPSSDINKLNRFCKCVIIPCYFMWSCWLCISAIGISI